MVTIRPAREADLKNLRLLRAAAAADLTAKYGNGHWSRVPTLSTLRRHLDMGALYVIADEGAVVGTFKLDDRKIGFYKKAWFANPDDPAGYLMNMAIAPERQRQGIGRQAMVAIEAMLKERGLKSLRFDAYDGAAGAGPFYRKCGYRQVHRGTVNATPLEYFEKTF